MDLGLEDTTGLVTGGSSGLGLACAEVLAREGVDVAICARDADRLETAEDKVNEVGGGTVLSIQGDITDDQGDVADIVEQTVATFGRLDHLVVSTGGPQPGDFTEVDARDWYMAYDLLVMSLTRLAEATYPYLAADGPGSITVIGSTATREPIEELVLSSVVRRATVGLVKILAREFAPAVRVNTVLAGPHATPYLDEVIRAGVEQELFESAEDGFSTLRASIPLDRVGDPEALGEFVAFLASERATFVTGAATPVDGGLLRG